MLAYENGQAVTYTYAGLNGATTPLIQTISQNGVTLTYSYGDNGNINQGESEA